MSDMYMGYKINEIVDWFWYQWKKGILLREFSEAYHAADDVIADMYHWVVTEMCNDRDILCRLSRRRWREEIERYMMRRWRGGK